MTSKSTKWANFFERVAWTLLQVVTAEGILLAWEALRGPITENRGLILVALTTVLAAIKNAAAQAFGSETGATLPEGTRPVAAENVVALVKPDAGVVAGSGSELSNGTPVEVQRAA